MNPESISIQLMEAANLMLVGMVVVFAFLTLLIAGVKGLSLFCKTFPEKNNIAPLNQDSRQTNRQTDGELVAAISAAVHLHRNKK